MYVNESASVLSPYDYRLRYGSSISGREGVNFAFADVYSLPGVDPTTQHLFCAGANIPSNANLWNGKGQPFVAVLLDDVNASIMSNYQKNSIQTLFNHVYNPLLAAQDHLASLSVTDPLLNQLATQLAYSNLSIINTALQFALWEIIHETAGNWNIETGTVRVDLPQYVSGASGYPGFASPTAAYD